MMTRVSRSAMDALRGLVADYLAQGDTSEDIDESDLVEFLYAALDHARGAFPLMGRHGAVVEADEVVRDPGNIELFTALLKLDVKTPEECIATLVHVLSLQIDPGSSGRKPPLPRTYRASLDDWPDELGIWVGGHEHVAWFDNIFGIVTEPGWMKDRARRNQVFAAVDPVYSQLTFVELDRETARRLASFLLAGARRGAEFKAFERQARALVALFGPGTRLFSNKDLDEDELRNPFAHGDTVDLGTRDCCAGGSMLALLVTDGRRVVRLEERWDTWVES